MILLREVDEDPAQRTCQSASSEKIASEPICLWQSRQIKPDRQHRHQHSCREADRDIQDTIERADRALYMAKNTGRNRAFLDVRAGESNLSITSRVMQAPPLTRR